MTDQTRYKATTKMKRLRSDGKYRTITTYDYGATQTQAIIRLRVNVLSRYGHMGRVVDVYDRVTNEHFRL